MQQHRLLSRLILSAPDGNDGSKQAHQNRLQSRHLICEEMVNISDHWTLFTPAFMLPNHPRFHFPDQIVLETWEVSRNIIRPSTLSPSEKMCVWVGNTTEVGEVQKSSLIPKEQSEMGLDWRISVYPFRLTRSSLRCPEYSRARRKNLSGKTVCRSHSLTVYGHCFPLSVM